MELEAFPIKNIRNLKNYFKYTLHCPKVLQTSSFLSQNLGEKPLRDSVEIIYFRDCVGTEETARRPFIILFHCVVSHFKGSFCGWQSKAVTIKNYFTRIFRDYFFGNIFRDRNIILLDGGEPFVCRVI